MHQVILLAAIHNLEKNPIGRINSLANRISLASLI